MNKGGIMLFLYQIFLNCNTQKYNIYETIKKIKYKNSEINVDYINLENNYLNRAMIEELNFNNDEIFYFKINALPLAKSKLYFSPENLKLNDKNEIVNQYRRKIFKILEDLSDFHSKYLVFIWESDILKTCVLGKRNSEYLNMSFENKGKRYDLIMLILSILEIE